MPWSVIVAGMPTGSDAPETVLLTLRLDLDTETISGTIDRADGGEHPFWGWLELSAALDVARGVVVGSCMEQWVRGGSLK